MPEIAKAILRENGIESLHGQSVVLPIKTVFEAPLSIKWMQIEHSISMGAFSYAVSGYFFATKIGRYVSMGESIQIGRHNHPLNYMTTSPFFYTTTKLFDVGDNFESAEQYHAYRVRKDMPYDVKLEITDIGHDVWVGHGAFIKPGVKIGIGAVIAAHSVVVKDVPPFAIVAGNPATIKKYRIKEELIPAVLESQWWEYAPWDLGPLSIENPEKFLEEFDKKKDEMPKYTVPLYRPFDVTSVT